MFVTETEAVFSNTAVGCSFRRVTATVLRGSSPILSAATFVQQASPCGFLETSYVSVGLLIFKQVLYHPFVFRSTVVHLEAVNVPITVAVWLKLRVHLSCFVARIVLIVRFNVEIEQLFPRLTVDNDAQVIEHATERFEASQMFHLSVLVAASRSALRYLVCEHSSKH